MVVAVRSSRLSRPGRLSSASSSHSLGAVAEDFTWFFRTFPQIKKSARLGLHSGSGLPPESSPSTRRACAVPVVPEEDEPALEVESEEEDPDGWMNSAGRG